MKDQIKGRPLHRIDEVAAGTLKAADGRPVHAVSTYTDAVPPADGRPLHAASLLLNEGQASHAVSFYAAGTLMTADGRPVHAVALFDAAGAAVGGSSFTPLSLFSLGEQGGWYDPSDASTTFEDSAGTVPASINGVVGYIADKSGRGNHRTQATTAAKPILRSDGTNRYLEFDGVDDTLTAAAAYPLSPSMAICIGVQYAANASSAFLPVAQHYVATTERFRLAIRGDLQQAQSSSRSVTLGKAVQVSGTAALSQDANHVLCGRFIPGFNTFKVDGVAVADGVNTWLDADTVANAAPADSVLAFGSVYREYGSVFVARDLTAGEDENLCDYIASKCGVVIP